MSHYLLTFMELRTCRYQNHLKPKGITSSPPPPKADKKITSCPTTITTTTTTPQTQMVYYQHRTVILHLLHSLVFMNRNVGLETTSCPYNDHHCHYCLHYCLHHYQHHYQHHYCLYRPPLNSSLDLQYLHVYYFSVVLLSSTSQ